MVVERFVYYWRLFDRIIEKIKNEYADMSNVKEILNISAENPRNAL